jgi:hypothetical protein
MDVAVNEINAVIKAELVLHAYSANATGAVYSFPFKVSVKSAAGVKVDQNSLNVTSGQDGMLKGTLERAAGFERAVTINLAGLPAGYQSGEITVPRDATTFEVPIKPGAETAAKTIKANLTVKLAGGGSILPDVPLELKVAPAN